MIFGTTTSAAILLLLAAQPGGDGERPPTLVHVTPATRGGVPDLQSFVGTVLPIQRAVVGSAVDGRVEQLAVDRGEFVEAGATLASLLETTIRLEVAAAEAELELRCQERDELLEGTRPEEIAKAEAAWKRAVALSEYAASRQQRLMDASRIRGSVSVEELEAATADQMAAERLVDETKATYDLALAGPREEQKLQAKARVAIAQAVLDGLREQLSKYTIRAPFRGYITVEHTERGAWLSRGDPVVEMINIDQVEITVSVPEQYIGRLALDAVATVRLEALPDRPPLPGSVGRIVPEADVRSRSFPVTILVGNPGKEGEHVLKAGMLANVELAVGPTRDALLVPKDALVLHPTRDPIVFVVRGPDDGPQTAVPVTVKLGVYMGPYVEVIGDIGEGDPVVVVGNERLSPRPPLASVRAISAELPPAFPVND
jgi:RND family efflux transporter MFP subunit